ncbi:MAG: Rne/Rng family ribonuclease [Pseudanabaenaceae cyanobacterium]
MPKQIIIAEQHRIAAVFSEDHIEELVVATGNYQVGDVYLGVVENVLTSIDAAFVNIGDGDRNGFIHISDLGPLKMRRTANSIGELLVPQQRVLVQVMKEPTGNKGPRLTGNISLPGRYVVLLPFGKGVNLSRRIRSEAERNRLRALAILVKPSGMGVLVRTEAEGMSEDQIIEDLDNLQRQWESIQQDAGTTRHASLLDRERDFIQRVLRDLYTSEVNRIVTDTNDGLRRVKQALLTWGDGKISPSLLLDHHRERTPILEYFRVNAAIREALKPRVDLPSGGYIIIQPTEALTVIDVNSGSFTRSQTSRETVLWTNCEAATEIARQIRLRNLAGVIVVDFIDMESRRDQLQLLENFNKALRSDKSRPQIAQLTELGLVELTRKRQGQSVYELFGRPCTSCGGLGHLVHLPGETTTQLVDSSPRIWETRLSHELDLTVDEDMEDSDLSGGLEPNLVNHPNYQERSSRRGRRRSVRETGRDTDKPTAAVNQEVRGRESSSAPRETVREVVPVPEPTSSYTPAAFPASYPANTPTNNYGAASRTENRDLVTKGNSHGVNGSNGISSSGFGSGFTVAAPVVSGNSTNGNTATASNTINNSGASVAPKPEVDSTPERPTKRERQKNNEPPEVVVVEMTAEQQEIYALMGVSPLVLTDVTGKDPRNTIVTVTLPGVPPVLPPGAVLAALRSGNDSEDSLSGSSSSGSVGGAVILSNPDESGFGKSGTTDLAAAIPAIASSLNDGSLGNDRIPPEAMTPGIFEYLSLNNASEVTQAVTPVEQEPASDEVENPVPESVQVLSQEILTPKVVNGNSWSLPKLEPAVPEPTSVEPPLLSNQTPPVIEEPIATSPLASRRRRGSR